MTYIDKKHIYWIREVGHFNYVDPKETQVNYSFQFPRLTFQQINELDIRKNFTIDEEKDSFEYEIDDDSSALEVAQYIYNVYKNKYFWHGGEKGILKLVEYLESQEEEQEKLRLKYNIDYSLEQVKEWTDKWENYMDEYIYKYKKSKANMEDR